MTMGSPKCTEDANFEMNERCFPRISFLKSRIRNIIPRMNRILEYEFNQPSEGIKKLRSDTEECQAIENFVKTEALNIRVMSTNKTLCKYLSPEKLSIDQQNMKSCYKSKPTRNQLRSELLGVPVVLCRPQELCHIKPSDAIITVVADKETSLFEKLEWMADLETNKQFVVICHEDVDSTSSDTLQTPQNQPPSTSNQQMSSSNQPSSPYNGPPSPSTSLQSLNIQTSPPRRQPHLLSNQPSSPNNGPPSPRRRHKSSPSMQPHTFSDQPSSSRRQTQPPSMQPTSPGQPVDSGSSTTHLPKYLSPKSRYHSPVRMPNVKRSKPDTDELGHDIAQASACPIEVDDTDVLDPNLLSYANRGLKELRECIQYQFEVKVASILEKMVKLLKDVRNRRDESARVNCTTILDKLIYEVEGLLSLCKTNNSKELRMKFDKLAINPKLQHELLSIEGMYGCGLFYHRMNIHIDHGDKTEVLKKVNEVMAKYDYTEKDYDTLVVQAELSVGGEIFLCSM